VFERFVDGLPAALNPNGKALVILSTDGDSRQLLNLIKDSAFNITVLAEQDLINEVLTIYEVNYPAFSSDYATAQLNPE
jgi:hypothetical protein